MSEWRGAVKVADYRSRAAHIPHRLEGETVVIEVGRSTSWCPRSRSTTSRLLYAVRPS
jgi:hypothetical protein